MREKMISSKPKKHSRARTKPVAKNDHVSSWGERAVKSVLTRMGIEFVEEKQFPGMESPLSGVSLSLDFYIRDRKIAIEYDGKHHFRLLPGEAPHELERRRLNDLSKDLFCKQRGIKLIRIKYTQKRYIREILAEALKQN